MIRIRKNNKKWIAAFFISVLTVQNFFPAVAYALTSGPSQPEMQKFQPAGANDMVDLFSGDFKYDIPLMDVGGYPVNLSYHSGGNMEDEASWVGMGWSLNPGVMNRTMRGIPDDFTGDQPSLSDPADLIKTTQHRKDFKKIGGQLVLKPTIFAWELGSASLHLGVYKDNYYGIGGEIGASVSFNTDRNGNTLLTAGLDLNSDSKKGVTVEPSFSISGNQDESMENISGTLSGSFSYNTRSGLENVNLGQTFGMPSGTGSFSFGVASFKKEFIHSYTPTFSTNTKVSSTTFNLDVGPALLGGYVGLGGSGYVTTETNTEPHSAVPAYGYLNYSKGKNNVNALLDFNRERDMVFMTTAPAIPVPVATEDYFEATSQAGSQQFRPFYNGDYTVFDRTFTKSDNSTKGGLTVGGGNLFQGGARLDLSSGQAITHKWINNNQYLQIAEPPAYTGTDKQVYEDVYFKKAGEQTQTDPAFYSTIGNDVTEKVAITGTGTLFHNSATTFPDLQSATGSRVGTAIQRQSRDIRTSTFRYLTAQQASLYGLDKSINGQPRVDPVNTDPTTTVHKAHHISEVTVTDNDGKRMVYGIPVYNTDQEEVSFSAVAPAAADLAATRKSGLIPYTPGVDNSENNQNGRENIYNKKIIPPYATSYLLTGILSPDYVDKTGDGISDDDLGTAVKFNYGKLNGSYNWRAPYESNMASYNEGFISEPKDDKGNYVFGQKEIWYLQSIGSKTMIAQFFTSDRQDGLGVAGENGGQNTSLKLQKLDSIRLFSKADLQKNGVNAVPIKVAHFEYDYSLYPGVPNNSGTSVTVPDPNNPGSTIDLNAAKGKLTLKKVYFTFGSSSRGQSNPYLFSYDIRLIRDGSIANLPQPNSGDPYQVKEAADLYIQRQSDRWGTYKQSIYNPGQALNNSEFPYSLQTTDQDTYDMRQLADRFASKWQLNSITTPTGGIVSVEYESDDYSYVQDRKAMVMCPLAGVGANNQVTGMIGASKLYVTVPVATSAVDFQNTYLSGPNGQPWNNISFKIYTDVDNKGHWEYVYGYAEIDYTGTFDVSGNTVGIPVKMVNTYNPVSKAAWQMIQDDLPQYAYENYDNSDVNTLSGNVEAAVISIAQAFTNLRELFQSYDVTASGNHYADKVDLSHSMIRLNYPVGKVNKGTNDSRPTYGKLGGGSRVRTVQISDDWDNMTGVTGAKKAVYGLKYDYTMPDDQNNMISSGVASYEPQIGNEENPFHEPLNFTEKVEWSQDRFHHIEKPFGESYFPGPSVGYSQVKVTSYGSDYSETNPVVHAGYTVNEFYTDRDFPTQVDYLPLEQENYENDLILLLFASSYVNRVTTSQGFKVVLNDMHGKQKSTKIYDNAGVLISSTEYFYNVNDDNAQQKQLNNTVLALNTDGSIPAAGKLLATDAELVTDVRESTSTSAGTSIGGYAGLTDYVLWVQPFAAVNFNHTSSIRAYNSVSSIKVIHQYGILKEVRTTQNGSTLTAVNLLWDAQTGDVLLTQNQNEFDDYTYAFHYPAYMAYDGMGSAFKNIGAVFTGFTTGTDGKLADPATQYLPYISPGDELVGVDPGNTNRGWILQSLDGSLRFIDQSGNFITGTGNYMVFRSGRRNILDASAGAVISLNNPLVQVDGTYLLRPGVDKRILDAKALTYKDEWGLPIPKFQTTTSPTVTDGCLPSTFDVKQDIGGPVNQFFQVLFLSNVKPSVTGRNIFAVQSDNVTLADLVNQAISNNILQSDALSTFLQGCSGSNCHFTDLSQINYYLLSRHPDAGNPGSYILQSGDQAYIGTATQRIGLITFGTVSSTVSANLESGPSPLYCSEQIQPCDGTGNGSITVNMTTSQSNCNNNIYDMTATWSSTPFTYTTGPPVTACNDPLNQVVNPYFQGIKGNWRADSNYVYQVNRVQVPGNTAQTGGTNVRGSGYYASFSPYWTLANHSFLSIPQVTGATDHSLIDPRWVWSNQPIYFDQKGNEVENVDALKRYGSALYGYQQSLATAVATNARHNEIAFDGFEDYYFSLPTTSDPCPLQRHLDLGIVQSGGQYCNGGSCIVAGIAHSGNYSLNLGGSISITKPAGSTDPSAHVISFDGIGRCTLLSNEQAAGFAPINGKNYLLSMWVQDGHDSSNLINGLQVNINGSSVDFSNRTVPVVEDWKKLDIPFTGGSNFILQMTGGANVYIDDLRILPFDAQLKSFVYDDQSLRLLGQLDENNFGIFYEYDEEGTPVRVKKETERGVMTVKESRQSFRQPR